MKTEIWLPVPIKEYKKNYQVSNFGNVRSLNYLRTGKPNILKPAKNEKGYLKVVLHKNGKCKTFKVHRLVVQAFLPNLLDYTQVNHIDEDKTNNFVGTPENDFMDGNLEWCDGKYNTNYGTRNERVAKKLSKPVLQLTKTGELVRTWSSTMEAGRNGFTHNHISSCCRGKLKSHKGFVWRYK